MAPKKGSASAKGNASKKSSAPPVPDSEHIVFTNSQQDKKKKDANQPEGPPRPDARKVIGGQSWTGKLPVNLLSEHCQRQKWNKPDYQGRQVSGSNGEKMHRSWVVLSKTDPKTGDVTRLPSFQLPTSSAHLADQPTALEARHFAAAYALFRISSMKNLSMALPPFYRDLWKGDFQRLKEEDVKEDRAWKYDADPFAAEVKRQEIKAKVEKRKQEQLAAPPKIEPLSLVNSSASGITLKGWDRAPRIELGQSSRMRLESIIRTKSTWNTAGTKMTKAERVSIVSDLAKSGFLPSHIQEALDYCGSREEVLEWLLIYLPEDSLPSWSFPPGYHAGVSLVTSDLSTDAKVKRLSEGGYSSQLCLQALRDNDGSEALAMEALQFSLAPPKSDIRTDLPSDADLWAEEMTALEAIFAERVTVADKSQFSIKVTPSSSLQSTLMFRLPKHGYPICTPPILVIHDTKMPSYVRLSIIKRAVEFAQENLLGDQMVFSLIEWLEESIPKIVEQPGKLVDLEISRTSFTVQRLSDGHLDATYKRKKRLDRTHQRDMRSNSLIYEAWKVRQDSEAQKKMLASREKLPAWAKRHTIIEEIDRHQVTLITGETGSGKSTQAIQFVLDDAIQKMKGSSANLICTQPRRVAALSLCDRVGAERCIIEGDEVGYIIRGDSKASANTKITFQTTGVLLRRLQGAENVKAALANVSHVFVDEVHERSLDTDFLLALLRDALPVLPHLKIVLMSATLNADTFANYFGGSRSVGRVHVEGRTYPVQDFYLDDVIHLTQNESNHAVSAASEGLPSFDVGRAIQNLGMGINYRLIADLVQHIDKDLGNNSGGVLVFVPGTMEIDRCQRALSDLPGVHSLPLHASLTPAEQRMVFKRPPPGKRKVVVATNVAETSITIEDIVAVIDTGKVKETNYDPTSNVVRLEEVWASQAACKQRRGRAGRVQAGKCYKLFTRNVEQNMLAATAPEMHRTPLEQLCLSVKATGSERNVEEFLARTISPPDSRAVATAMRTLKRMGALENERLTGLGTYLAMIPADLRCAKLLIYGVLFECLDPCLTIAAILTTKSPFVSPRDKRDEAKETRLSFSSSSDGDLILDCAAFEQWKEHSSTTTSRYRALQDWCGSRFLSLQTLRDIDSTRRQLRDSLVESGLLPVDYSRVVTTRFNKRRGNTMLLRALIAGALNPQIARIQMPDKKYIASVSGAKELDAEAKAIKYFNEENGRVFVHPSSVLFDAQGFSGAAAFVSYFTKMETSKTFIRDLTPLNAYALLLFGGPIEIDTSGQGLVVDGWLKLKGWARIGVLASRLRLLLDDELTRRIDSVDPSSQDDEGLFDIVRQLVELNGQDK
ncbi:putative ATP-dependent RNA helicase ucp12 [Knufia peltigerae]|uniref:ATP-dependent RNA helicase ucp12 n=1 Tax=Knufia peltigerae TaxID=1002370 RepID=A0AA39D059_9EURO|nr:putative ATP-dependent RNA helicase ucp12 [Knufia peltigerae]